MSHRVHVELLVGRRVRDTNGEIAGRIESIHARWRGKECFVEEYHLGPAGLLAVLGIWPFSREPLRVPWSQLDLSDPDHPRLRCAREDL